MPSQEPVPRLVYAVGFNGQTAKSLVVSGHYDP